MNFLNFFWSSKSDGLIASRAIIGVDVKAKTFITVPINDDVDIVKSGFTFVMSIFVNRIPNTGIIIKKKKTNNTVDVLQITFMFLVTKYETMRKYTIANT